MKAISFNTGRLYTASGQRIRAACDGEVMCAAGYVVRFERARA
ncbi:MAG TPA: hypothetical protein VFJ18_07345 [Pararhizobium sp.]|nr:hypothetical protein [Pararhizobium sp.]